MRAVHVRQSSMRARRSHVTVTKAASTKSKPGFRWDPANSRWILDKKAAAAGGNKSTVMKPFTGSEYTVWPVMHTELTEKRLKTISPSEAEKLVKSGWKLVDVRLPDQYDRQHPVGSVNVPLYRYVQGNSQWDNIKRLAMAGVAMKATERNPDFAKEAAEKLGKNAKVIVMCDIGGTLKTKVTHGVKSANDPDRAFGRESRSLKAAYELLQLGWSAGNVAHLAGGVPQWRFDGYPVEATSK